MERHSVGIDPTLPMKRGKLPENSINQMKDGPLLAVTVNGEWDGRYDRVSREWKD